jgi:hypothetical protein
MWRNCTVCLVGITLSLSAAGCVVQAGHPSSGGHRGSSGGPAPVSDSGLTIRWDLATLDDKLTDCDAAGTATVALRATHRSSAAQFTASFPCDAGIGVVTGLPPGDYALALDLLDLFGRVVSVVDHPGVPVFTGRLTQPDVALFPIQTWDLLWTIGIERLSGGVVAATCRDVGATTARFTTRLEGEAPETYELPCEDYGAVSTAIRPGHYEVRLLLLDARGRAINDTGPGFFEVTFDEPAELDADFVF